MFCVSLCEWMAQTCSFVYYTHTEACDVSLNEDLNTRTTSPELLRESLHDILPFHLRKTSIRSNTNRKPIKTKIQFTWRNCDRNILIIIVITQYFFHVLILIVNPFWLPKNSLLIFNNWRIHLFNVLRLRLITRFKYTTEFLKKKNIS